MLINPRNQAALRQVCPSGWLGNTELGNETVAIIARILVALLIGSLIGLERSFHGRPAGFRTHALVSIASALLMLVTVYQGEWMTAVTPEMIRTDPTRMAQGIMTGIGFSGCWRDFQGGTDCSGIDDRSLNLGYSSNRHPGRHRILLSRNLRCRHHTRCSRAIPARRTKNAKRILCTSFPKVRPGGGDQ